MREEKMKRNARVFLGLCVLVSFLFCSCGLFDRTPQKFLEQQKKFDDLQIKKGKILDKLPYYNSLKAPTEDEKQTKMSLENELQDINSKIDRLERGMPPDYSKMPDNKIREKLSIENKRNTHAKLSS
jgi:predicted  nucleic acid-binding Zn-ribbon protein